MQLHFCCLSWKGQKIPCENEQLILLFPSYVQIPKIYMMLVNSSGNSVCILVRISHMNKYFDSSQ